jgi:hypothetical protein
MAGLCSTATKYPGWRMLAKTKAWRNIAPPKQLKPKLWKTKGILRMNDGVVVINNREY